MLKLKAVLEKKINEFSVSDCQIEEIIELAQEEYLNFRNHLSRDADFIAEHKNLMYVDENYVHHCLLVIGEDGTEGVLVQCGGYDYARYASLLPGARDFVTAQLNELADLLIREGTQNTKDGTWPVRFEASKEKYGISLGSASNISSKLFDILESRPEIASVQPDADCFDMLFFVGYCPNLSQRQLQPTDPDENISRLSDLIRIPIENLHLVHHEVDMMPATIVYLDSETLTDAGKAEWGDVLDSQVMRVFHGIYGIQAECVGVSPQRLQEFSLMLAGYCPSEDYDRWIRDAPDSPNMTMKL